MIKVNDTVIVVAEGWGMSDETLREFGIELFKTQCKVHKVGESGQIYINGIDTHSLNPIAVNLVKTKQDVEVSHPIGSVWLLSGVVKQNLEKLVKSKRSLLSYCLIDFWDNGDELIVVGHVKRGNDFLPIVQNVTTKLPLGDISGIKTEFLVNKLQRQLVDDMRESGLNLTNDDLLTVSKKLIDKGWSKK